MNRTTVLCAVLILLALPRMSSGGVPQTITQQGRLLDDTGAPLEGAVSLTFSFYETATGGVALASENHVVVAEDGLYSVQLGSLTMSSGVLSLPEVWMGITVGTDAELQPRLKLSSVPYAMNAGRVQGDVLTSPGSVRVGYPFDPDIRERVVVLSSDGNGASIGLVDSVKATQARAKGIITVKASSGGTSGRSSMSMDVDDDGDGLPESDYSVSLGVGATAVKASYTVPTDATRASKIDGNLQVDEATFTLGAGDTDLDGITDWQTSDWAIYNGGVWQDTHIDDDANGLPESSILDSITPTSVDLRRALDSDNNGNNENWDFQRMSSTGVTQVKAVDVDQDGLEDFSVWQKVDNSEASVSTRRKSNSGGSVITDGWDMLSLATGNELKAVSLNGLPPGEPVIGTLKLSTDVNSSSIALGDVSGDGTLDLQCVRDSVEMEAVVPNPWGGSHHKSHVDPIESREILKTFYENGDVPTQEQRVSSTGATTSVTFENPSGSSSASLSASPMGRGGMQVSINDGFSRRSASLGSSPTGVGHDFVWDAGGDGIPEYSSSHQVSGSSGFIRIRDDDANRVDLTVDGSGTTLSVVPPSAGLYEFSLQVTDASGLMSMTNGAGAVSMQMDADGRLGVGGAADATNPIHHSSGAHLTAGGVWTNASDKNLKENFSEVDGEEILEKIEELPISEWSYKAEENDVRHIGPTAQDFKSAFGLGSDDKSISTIDPSGIALAAIKELIKQNEELRKRIKALEERLK